MRAWILSDLHIDSGEPIYLGVHPDCDVIIMAGDLSDGSFDPVPWLLKTFSDAERQRLVYVPGNHDYYGVGFDCGRRLVRLEREAGIRVLDKGTTEIEGQRFIGATLWSDFKVPERSYGMLGDFANIPDFTPQEWRRQHYLDLSYLRNSVRPGDVVVTHHAPSFEGLEPRMQHDLRFMGFRSGYATDLEQVVQDLEPAAWIHGHTHVTRQYEVGGVPVISNARGRSTGPMFQPDLVVEIGSHRPRLAR